MCFLRRGEGRAADEYDVTVISPLFYRLTVNELDRELRLDRLAKDGNPLYYESRFFERVKNGEPGASIANVKASLQHFHGVMGGRNDWEASNHSSHLMTKGSDKVLEEHYENVRRSYLLGLSTCYLPSEVPEMGRAKRMWTALESSPRLHHPSGEQQKPCDWSHEKGDVQ